VPSPSFDVRPLTGHIGAELVGLDLAAGCDETLAGALNDALLAHHVVFAPAQFLTPLGLLELAGHFGEILRNPRSPKVEGFPDVTELVTHDGRAPDIWHFDTSYTEVPPKLSCLSMVTSPPQGGDTLFVSAYALYDSFSPALRAFLGELSVTYDSATRGSGGHVATHPLVHVHPETARTCLLFDPMYSSRVVELTESESDAVLALLRASVADPTYACRHRWHEGDLAIWDNRCTLHRVASDFVGERVIQRVTVAGTPPQRPSRQEAP
jgi:taurine dioxygenase